jgi:hypothetical protein
MRFLFHYPPPPLDEFVDSFWLIEDGQVPRKEQVFPSGTAELVINLHDDQVRIHDPIHPERYNRHSGAVVSGTYSRAFVCDAMQHHSMLGVHFRPGGAFPFLNVPATELAGTHADLKDLWGRQALVLREQVCAANVPRKRFSSWRPPLLTACTASRGAIRRPGSPLGRQAPAPPHEMRLEK